MRRVNTRSAENVVKSVNGVSLSELQPKLCSKNYLQRLSLQKQRSVETGTNDVASSALTYTGKIGVQKRLSADPNEHQNYDDDSETAVLTTPGRTRTCDLRIRNPLLYPPELRAPQL